MAAFRKYPMENVGIIIFYLPQVIEYFATNEWAWSNDNLKKLNMELTEVYRKNLNFDISALSWPDFIDDYVEVVVW